MNWFHGPSLFEVGDGGMVIHAAVEDRCAPAPFAGSIFNERLEAGIARCILYHT